MSPDRLLAPYLREAGLPAKAKSYGNWESDGLDGHTAGHYLSALALMIASGDDKDGEMRRRLDYMVDELEKVQKANGNGYVGGVPGSKVFWQGVSEGNVGHFGRNGCPGITCTKCSLACATPISSLETRKPRTVLVGFGDWADKTISGLTEAQMQQMVGTEYGGMNEVIADIYAITGDKKYLEAGKRFNHHVPVRAFGKPARSLTGMHANTQIPKIIGMERIAALTGDQKLHTGADFFWNTVIKNRTVAFGGNSVSEHFNDPKDFGGMLQHREGPETCNTYNMLKLTEELFEAQPKASYVDYYEKALYNHILASINVKEPGYVYFTPLRPDHYRVYSKPGQDFWCCVGSGMENPGKYGEFIYARNAENFFVNLFIPSEVSVPESGLMLRQETKFPDEARTQISLKLQKAATFTLNIRHPEWVTASGFAVKINGRAIPVKSNPSSYAAIRRQWRNGDKIEVSLPMRTTTERFARRLRLGGD